MRRPFLGFFVLCIATLVLAQQTMNNDAIVKMVKAGLSDSVVVATIQASPGQYDTSTSALVALKSAGVDDTVVAAMIAKVAAPATTVAGTAAAATSADPNNPDSPHEAGIWVYTQARSGPKMVELEPSVYSSGKTGGMFATAMTYGIAKTKTKAVIRDAHSNTRVSHPDAVFYFYFEKQEAGLSNASSPFGGTSTPNEYVLLKFDVKGDTRETVVGKFNAYGASGGVDDKALVAFGFEKLRPGVYKVTPKAPLVPGEYGFMSPGGAVVAGPYASTATSNRVFDFGVGPQE
jgi:hypothetical protein